MLDSARISALLAPFLGDTEAPPELVPKLQTYLELLLRWNSRINLTAIRDPEQIVSRHFGESVFAARLLYDQGAFQRTPTLSDIGSGAGFPGIPIKLFAPQIHVTLIESNHKKAAFLRELIRYLNLTAIEVLCARAETLASQYSVVTLRAVEKFEHVLPVVAGLVKSGGNLCLLIGTGQQSDSQLGSQAWERLERYPIPLSSSRVVLIARKAA